MDWAGRAGMGGPFDPRHALTIATDSSAGLLQMPLIGDHRREIYRNNRMDTQYNYRAATSLTGLFEDWLYFLDNDFLVRISTPISGFTVSRSKFAEVGDLPLWDVLVEPWPHANPGVVEFDERSQRTSAGASVATSARWRH